MKNVIVINSADLQSAEALAAALDAALPFSAVLRFDDGIRDALSVLMHPRPIPQGMNWGARDWLLSLDDGEAIMVENMERTLDEYSIIDDMVYIVPDCDRVAFWNALCASIDPQTMLHVLWQAPAFDPDGHENVVVVGGAIDGAVKLITEALASPTEART